MKYYVITEGIKESLDKVFAGLLVGSMNDNNPNRIFKLDLLKVLLQRLRGRVAENIFFDEYAIFYEILQTMKLKVFNKQQLFDIVELNKAMILSSPYVELEKFYACVPAGVQITNDDLMQFFRGSLGEYLERLSNITVTEEEFNSALELYILWYKDCYMNETIQNMFQIQSEQGLKVKERGDKYAKHLKGLGDCESYYQKRRVLLDSLITLNVAKDLSCDESWITDEQEKDNKNEDSGVFDLGLSEIVATMGKLRYGNFLGILGAPKTGKTRFSAFLAEKALSEGLNVAVWPLEGTQEEWLSLIISSYIARKYKDANNNNLFISSKYILERRYLKNPMEMQIIEAARAAIAQSLARGRLSFIGSGCYVEDFREVLKDHYDTKNPYNVLIIDPLINIMSRTSASDRVGVVSNAYIGLKFFINYELPVPCIAIATAQLKQTAIDELRRNPDMELGVTSGGVSSETIRTPDEVIAVFSTREERDAKISWFYGVASRHSSLFRPCQVRADFGSCYYWSDASLNQI